MLLDHVLEVECDGQLSYFWRLTKTYSSLNTHILKIHLVLPSTRNTHLGKGFPLEVTAEVKQEAGTLRAGGSALLPLPAQLLQRRVLLPQGLLQPLDSLLPYRLLQVWGSHREGIISERTFQNGRILFGSD